MAPWAAAWVLQTGKRRFLSAHEVAAWVTGQSCFGCCAERTVRLERPWLSERRFLNDDGLVTDGQYAHVQMVAPTTALFAALSIRKGKWLTIVVVLVASINLAGGGGALKLSRLPMSGPLP